MLRLGLIFSLVLGVGAAHAERKVDWSEYLESPSDRPLAIKSNKTIAPADDAAPAKAGKGKKAKAKKAAEKSKSKAKRKARRRR